VGDEGMWVIESWVAKLEGYVLEGSDPEWVGGSEAPGPCVHFAN
jgi:hypothetical protein